MATNQIASLTRLATRWFVVLALVTVPASARAEDGRKGTRNERPANRAAVERSAQLHHDAGRENYLAGRYALAITEFEAAYALLPEPILLYNLAQAHRKNGSPDKALLFYQRYLAAAPRARDRGEVEEKIRDLEAEMSRTSPAPQAPAVVTATQPAQDLTYRPPPPPSPAPPTAAKSLPASEVIRAHETSRGLDQHRLRAQLSIGAAQPFLTGSDINTATLLSLGLSGAYVFGLGAGRQLDLGVAGSWSPLFYERVSTPTAPSADADHDVRSNLLGLHAGVALRLPIGVRLSVGPTLAAGVVWWAGLGERNPFSSGGEAAIGPIAMPSVQASIAGLFAITDHVFLGVDVGGSVIKTVGDALEQEVSSIVRAEVAASLGVGF